MAKISRKKFIESVGATCANWQWSWSFINVEKKFIIFGEWDANADGLIFSEDWNGPGSKQSREHIRLVEEEGYLLKTFPMEYAQTEDGKPQIKSFKPELTVKRVFNVGSNWYVTKPERIALPPEEVQYPEIYEEGATKKVSVNIYERNSEARRKCIAKYGYSCQVCEFDFEEKYGELGKEFIHVHHLVPLSDIKKEYKLNPTKDLVPVCPNCHAMLHKTQPPLLIEQLKEILRKKST
ncbi:HNH endonuclease [Alteromonas macleodii]|uniref:HNH endonuclease family protein n=1 Tax=Alteromonas macleodii TaxID=28108 RepID=A0AB36FQZ0_ALTMA|nr:HNH endonuclease [Alteromonas macleodii]OES30823.1 HNH endonuclease family protein [Alteromonas macleodii]OES31323.1 HNH endonuclease family protein [Alteromonas macleodii]OES31604.1 HNH endonuclease family protein [Alteromonas macleodii]OES40869.1 HNH endonuclease family protein [Alteromonas macleodii]